MIKERSGVKYTLKQIRIILKKFGMKYRKPYPKDYRRPAYQKNSGKKIIIILDNFRSHHANKTITKTIELDKTLAFHPQYSPDLNPIKFIWKPYNWIFNFK